MFMEEDPRKVRLRELCTEGVERAGFQTIDPPRPIDIPPEFDLRGGNTPDVQAIGGDGIQRNYYVRPGEVGNKPLLGFIINIANALAQNDDVFLFQVTEETGPALEESCRASGVGLLVLQEDFNFLQVIAAHEEAPDRLSQRWLRKIQDARRALENRLEFELSALERTYQGTLVATADWKDAKKDKYLAYHREVGVTWREWSDRLTERISAIASAADEEELARILNEIDAGASNQ